MKDVTNTDNLFTNNTEDDIIVEELYENEETYMQALYHNTSTIYLYITVEAGILDNYDIHKSKFPTHLKAYESAEISKAMAANISNPKTIRVAVQVRGEAGFLFYDELIMNNNTLKWLLDKAKVKKKEDLIAKCVYIRHIAKCENLKMNVIEYIINNKGIMQDMQFV